MKPSPNDVAAAVGRAWVNQMARPQPFIAIDPGNKESAVAAFDEDGMLILSNKMPNEELLMRLKTRDMLRCDDRYYLVQEAKHVAIEMIACYGMAVGAEVFDTCVWIGRFLEALGRPHTMVFRRDVKLHLCNSVRAKDGNVRQAIIDKYGGKEKAIGNKKNPGPLYGVAGDEWAAIGVGLTYLNK